MAAVFAAPAIVGAIGAYGASLAGQKEKDEYLRQQPEVVRQATETSKKLEEVRNEVNQKDAKIAELTSLLAQERAERKREKQELEKKNRSVGEAQRLFLSLSRATVAKAMNELKEILVLNDAAKAQLDKVSSTVTSVQRKSVSDLYSNLVDANGGSIVSASSRVATEIRSTLSQLGGQPPETEEVPSVQPPVSGPPPSVTTDPSSMTAELESLARDSESVTSFSLTLVDFADILLDTLKDADNVMTNTVTMLNTTVPAVVKTIKTEIAAEKAKAKKLKRTGEVPEIRVLEERRDKILEGVSALTKAKDDRTLSTTQLKEQLDSLQSILETTQREETLAEPEPEPEPEPEAETETSTAIHQSILEETPKTIESAKEAIKNLDTSIRALDEQYSKTPKRQDTLTSLVEENLELSRMTRNRLQRNLSSLEDAFTSYRNETKNEKTVPDRIFRIQEEELAKAKEEIDTQVADFEDKVQLFTEKATQFGGDLSKAVGLRMTIELKSYSIRTYLEYSPKLVDAAEKLQAALLLPGLAEQETIEGVNPFQEARKAAEEAAAAAKVKAKSTPPPTEPLVMTENPLFRPRTPTTSVVPPAEGILESVRKAAEVRAARKPVTAVPLPAEEATFTSQVNPLFQQRQPTSTIGPVPGSLSPIPDIFKAQTTPPPSSRQGTIRRGGSTKSRKNTLRRRRGVNKRNVRGPRHR